MTEVIRNLLTAVDVLFMAADKAYAAGREPLAAGSDSGQSIGTDVETLAIYVEDLARKLSNTVGLETVGAV